MKNCVPAKSAPEEKAFQPYEIEIIREHLWQRITSGNYDVNGYAILFASETGLREGEILSLKWEDITAKAIHVHSQQNDETIDGKKTYYYNPTTKNEKGVGRNGRYIPITDEIRKILDALQKNQQKIRCQIGMGILQRRW